MRGCTLYRHFNNDGDLLYVGISNNALSRLSGHAHISPWYREISKVTLQHFKSRQEAIIEERLAIEFEQPRYNIAHAASTTARPKRIKAPARSGLSRKGPEAQVASAFEAAAMLKSLRRRA